MAYKSPVMLLRARYTRPNAPLLMGFRISKSLMLMPEASCPPPSPCKQQSDSAPVACDRLATPGHSHAGHAGCSD